MHTNNKKLILEAIEIMRKTGSIDYAREFAREITKEAWSEVDKVLPESKAKEQLKAFAEYLITRKI
jgi:geranylgeranyl diphosphate synthase type I